MVGGTAPAQAVVVEGNIFVYVGDDAGAAEFQKSGMRVVDLAGRMLMSQTLV